MYNPPAFAVTDAERARELVRTYNFALVTAVLDGNIHFAYAATFFVERGEQNCIQFHLARPNPVASVVDGAPLKLSFLGPHEYVSPNWYAQPNQVPTWNYIAAEASGSVRRLNEMELVTHLRTLADQEERRILHQPPWKIGRAHV